MTPVSKPFFPYLPPLPLLPVSYAAAFCRIRAPRLLSRRQALHTFVHFLTVSFRVPLYPHALSVSVCVCVWVAACCICFGTFHASAPYIPPCPLATTLVSCLSAFCINQNRNQLQIELRQCEEQGRGIFNNKNSSTFCLCFVA